MTFSFEGITAEQYRLSPEMMRFDIFSLEIGQGTWFDYEALWADGDGNLFIDTSFNQYDSQELQEALYEPGYMDAEEFAYVLRIEQGFVVSMFHSSTERIRIESTKAIDTQRSKRSQPVCGFITDQFTLTMVNNELLAGTGYAIPGDLPPKA